MKTAFHYALLCILAAVFIRPCLASTGDPDPPAMRRVYDPVQVPAELLHELHGSDLESLRLFSFRNRRMGPILYQFDERLPNGDYIFTLGPEANAGLANNVLDPQDFLVFRIEDTGARAAREHWPAQDGIEIELVDPIDGARSYCYLVRFPDQAPPALVDRTLKLEHWESDKDPDRPMLFTAATYSVTGLVAEANNRVYKSFLPTAFIVHQSAGGSGLDFIDGIRTRAFVELFFGQFRFDVNERSVIGAVDRIRLGNVRGYGRQWFSIPFPLGLEGPRLYLDVFTYHRMIVTPMLFRMPFNPGIVITRGGLSIGFDLNEHAHGMRLYSPYLMEGVTVDGEMWEKEENFPEQWAPWYVLTGPQGTLIIRILFDPTMVKDGEVRFDYTDDRHASFPPDQEPGAIGYARGTLEFRSADPGYYPLRYEWYFPENFYDPKGLDRQKLTEIFNIVDAPLIIRASGREAQNRAMNPPPLVAKKR